MSTSSTSPSTSHDPPLRVIAIRDLLYCERLFYLTEVENIQSPNEFIYAGRRLHVERLPLDDESPEMRSLEVSSETWGVQGKVDAVRKRDGAWVAYEHKKGRCRRGEKNEPLAWPSDRIQVIAYALLIEEELGGQVREGRVRYHADNVTAIVPIDNAARDDLRTSIARAHELRQTLVRPPVTTNERLCTSCSLVPVCLPEEERLVEIEPLPSTMEAATLRTGTSTTRLPVPLPSHREKQALHVTAHKAYVSRKGETLVIKTDDANQTVPVTQIDALIIHGHGQVTTQALHMCAYHGISVQWMTFGGRFVAGTSDSPGRVQQRIRQFLGLRNVDTCLRLTRVTVHAKVECQLRYLLRASRGNDAARTTAREPIERIRESLKRVAHAESLDSLRGHEGIAAKAYFAAIPALLNDRLPESMRPTGRSKHPPKDAFNALLSFGYSLLFGLVHRTLLAVGLDPAFGYFHQPRSAAPPLVLDLMEIFRVLLVDMPVIASLNRSQWSEADFTRAATHVWLSDDGRKKAIALFEQRLGEESQHPHTHRAMTYSRLVELEARLLEKEWSGSEGLFGHLRLR